MVEHERRRADAESQAYRSGFAAGQEQAKQEAAQRIAARLRVISDGLARLDGALTAIETRLETEAVEVAVAVARKLAPELIAREPFAEISALATECFHHLVSAPHVVVRVGDPPPTRSPRTRSRKSRARAASRAGSWSHRTETLAPGDCRIEWADGGIARDHAATASAIDEMVGRYISARNAPAA